MAIAAAVLAGGAMIVYVLYKDTSVTFGGPEVDKLNAYLAEDCADVVYDNSTLQDNGWYKQTAAGAINEAAVTEFEKDMLGAMYNRNAVTKYFVYPHGIGGWVRNEIDSKVAEWKEETDQQRTRQTDTATGAALGGFLGAAFGGIGAIPGAMMGGFWGAKQADKDAKKIVSLQQPSLSPDQIAALQKMQAAIAAKQAECLKEEAQWNKQWNADFMNMIRFMASKIAANSPDIISDAQVDTFWAKNQVTLPPQMVAAQLPAVHTYVDTINAKYVTVPNVNITADEVQKVNAIVSNYVNSQFYDMIMWLPGVGAYLDLPSQTPASCTQMLIAIKKAGLSDQAAQLALAPCYYLTRLVGFKGAWQGDAAKVWQDPAQPPFNMFTAPTVAEAQKQAYNEILYAAETYLDEYYKANPTAGPLWTQDNCRYWFIQIGLDKTGINAGGKAMWQYMGHYITNLPAYQPV